MTFVLVIPRKGGGATAVGSEGKSGAVVAMAWIPAFVETIATRLMALLRLGGGFFQNLTSR